MEAAAPTVECAACGGSGFIEVDLAGDGSLGVRREGCIGCGGVGFSPASPEVPVGAFIDIVFDGPPSHESGRFIEVENPRGESIRPGEWVQDGDLWRLRIPNAYPAILAALEELAGVDRREYASDLGYRMTVEGLIESARAALVLARGEVVRP